MFNINFELNYNLHKIKSTRNFFMYKNYVFNYTNNTIKYLNTALDSQRGITPSLLTEAIYGPKRIGKSICLKAFSNFCNRDNIIPYYMKCSKYHIIDGDLLSKVTHFLNTNYDANIPTLNDSHKYDNINEFLKRDQKKLFLIIDEIDKLYEKEYEGKNDSAIKTLNQLSEIEKYNHYAYFVSTIGTLICGSTLSIPNLFSKENENFLKKRFPLVQYSPKLNIYSSLLDLTKQNDLKDINEITGTEYEKNSKLLYFFNGKNPGITKSKITPELFYKPFMFEWYLKFATRDYKTNYLKFDNLNFLKKITFSFYLLNKDFFNSLLKSKNPIVEITEKSWIENLKHLNLDDIKNIWKKIYKNKDENQFIHDLNYLIDYGLVTHNKEQIHESVNFYPQSVYMVIFFNSSSLLNKIDNSLDLVGDYFSGRITSELKFE